MRTGHGIDHGLMISFNFISKRVLKAFRGILVLYVLSYLLVSYFLGGYGASTYTTHFSDDGAPQIVPKESLGFIWFASSPPREPNVNIKALTNFIFIPLVSIDRKTFHKELRYHEVSKGGYRVFNLYDYKLNKSYEIRGGKKVYH